MFAKIEIEKGGGVTLNPSFSFQPDRRLIDALPGLSRETLAKAVVGELLTQIDCPGSYLHVLYNLICHAGWHSNRAWVSLPRLASLTSRISKCSAKTAQRAMEFWCRTIGIRKITDQTELLSGPGEHQFVDAGGKKRGEGGGQPLRHERRSVPDSRRVDRARRRPDQRRTNPCSSAAAGASSGGFGRRVPRPFHGTRGVSLFPVFES